MVRKAAKDRGYDLPVDRILDLDAQRRSLITDLDSLRAKRKEVSRELGRSDERPKRIIDQMRDMGTEIKALESEMRTVQEALNSLLLTVPNIHSDDTPLGVDETANIVVRTEGKQPKFDFQPLAHWELGERLDIVDFQRGVKAARSRFYILKDKGAKLQRSLISWMLDIQANEHGYQEMYMPYLVNRETVIASGQLPKFADNMYRDSEDDLWMVPTSEVPITGLHRDEILPPGALPLNYTVHSPCFRREKAAAGRDKRGLKRVHQFEKVEMYKLVEPEESEAALQQLVADAEDICRRLKIPYRIVQLCTGDLGFAAFKTYDLELWAPGAAEWLEVSSCSNCTDFQARRANIRYRPEFGERPRFVHTLNGSGLGLPRVVIAILENYQQADGTVLIPEVLRPYTGFDRIE